MHWLGCWCAISIEFDRRGRLGELFGYQRLELVKEGNDVYKLILSVLDRVFHLVDCAQLRFKVGQLLERFDGKLHVSLSLGRCGRNFCDESLLVFGDVLGRVMKYLLIGGQDL